MTDPPLDDVEFDRWRAAAESSIAMAAVARDAGFPHHACLHAEQAAQQALKGLLRGVGSATDARGHNLVALGQAAGAASGQEGSSIPGGALARLGRHYLPSRYPDAVPGGTPADNYSDEDAAQALGDARLVMEFVAAAWAALTGDTGQGTGADEQEAERDDPA